MDSWRCSLWDGISKNENGKKLSAYINIRGGRAEGRGRGKEEEEETR